MDWSDCDYENVNDEDQEKNEDVIIIKVLYYPKLSLPSHKKFI